MTLFFLPIVTGVALMLGINFWFVTENTRIGWYGLDNAADENRSFR
jgi:hypothetical protein